MSVTQAFAHYGVRLAAQPLSDEVKYHARRAVVDWYAALMPGFVMPVTGMLQTAIEEDLDRGTARLASGRAATPRAAALINGTASHAAEVDDIFKDAIYHPGAPVISAALALAQHLDADGDAFLRAVVAGYEISTRIGRCLGRAHYHYWHNTGTVGTFGAAAAAAVLGGLSAAQFAHALAGAATFASGLQQAFKSDSMLKPLHAGRAAEAGVLAALAARAGMTGAPDTLEGEFGMGRAMSDAPDWDAGTQDLDTLFNITRMTFKNHACCGHTFAPIDGALVLQQQHAIRPDDIEELEVHTYRTALDVAGNPAPVTASEARFSIPFVVATALVHGAVRLSAFADDRLSDPDLRALMQKIRLKVAPDLDARFPTQRAARVVIRLRSGETVDWLQPTRKGDPDMPLSDADLQDKFDELVTPIVGHDRAQHDSRVLWGLDESVRMRDVLASSL